MSEADVVNKGRNTAEPHGRGSRPASNDAYIKVIIKSRVMIRKQ